MARPTRSEYCLAPEDIDGFARGTADPQQRQKVLSHTIECMRCSTMVRAAQASAWVAGDDGPASGSSAAGLPPATTLSTASETLTFRDQSAIPASDIADRLRAG